MTPRSIARRTISLPFVSLTRRPMRPAPTTTSDTSQPVRDLSPREIAALAPLAVLVFWIGLQPKPFLDRMSPTLDNVAEAARPAVEAELHSSDRASRLANDSVRRD